MEQRPPDANRSSPDTGRSERSFRRYMVNYEADGLDGLIDRRLEQTSNRQAPVDEVIAMTDEYRRRYMGWNVKHFHSWYKRTGGTRSYTWEPMKDVTKMIRNHFDSIVAWAQTRQTNGFLEALNGLFQAAKRKARGYISIHTMRTVIFLIAGKLDFKRFNPYAA